MPHTSKEKPDIVQAFDFYEDREYYKLQSGLFFSSKVKVRTDRIKDWKEWSVSCIDMPDKILVNGEKYKLVKDSK